MFLIGSKHPPAEVAAVDPVTEGLLAVFVSATGDTDRAGYDRLYGLVDWYSDDGSICGLHSDQAMLRAPYRNTFTEIVVEETLDRQSYLVLLNGPDEQSAGAMSLELRNHLGVVRTARHARPMRPFTATRLELHTLFPDVVDFSDGRQLTVSGVFDSTGLFIRPYVMTNGALVSGYHGGDV